jgi:acyl-CoA hydrolase
MAKTRKKTAEIAHIAIPGDANAIDSVFGGRLLHIMDMAASIAARRHSGCRVITVHVSQVSFVHPIRIGQVILAKAMVNRAFNTSMEVGVKVFAEDTYKGTTVHACSGYFTFVAVDENGVKSRIPEVELHDETEKRRWEQAAMRRKKNINEKDD